MKPKLTCIELGMTACCYCVESSKSKPESKECLINKMTISIDKHGLRGFLVKCKPIIDYAQDDVVRYIIKCVELYYPSEQKKLQSLLTLL